MAKKDKLLEFFGDRFHKRIFLICVVTSVALIVASFLTPPMFVIDASVIAAVGELFGFAALGEVGAAVERGRKAKVSKGDTTLEISGTDEDKE